MRKNFVLGLGAALRRATTSHRSRCMVMSAALRVITANPLAMMKLDGINDALSKASRRSRRAARRARLVSVAAPCCRVFERRTACRRMNLKRSFTDEPIV